jgi:predicted secreted protein
LNNTETALENKMLFYLERTGGIAGLRMTVMLNTESLPLDDARKLYQMVEDAGFFSLPEKLPEPITGADFFIYKLTVEKFALSFSEGKKHTVEVSGPNLAEKLQPLIQALENHKIPEDKGKIVTLADNGKTITLQVNETFLLKLGAEYDWNIKIDDQKIISRVPNVAVVAGAQGIYKAHQKGRTKLTAIGNPVCRKDKPPCEAPTRTFSIQVVVTG